MKNVILAIITSLWFMISTLAGPVLYKMYVNYFDLHGDATFGVILMALILFLLSFFIAAWRWAVVIGGKDPFK